MDTTGRGRSPQGASLTALTSLLGVTFLATLAALVSYVVRTPCAISAGGNYCYSDVLGLYGPRHLYDRALPYLHGGGQAVLVQGHPVNALLTGHELEYPVLTGLFAWLMALPTDSLLTYLTLTALVLGALAVLSARLLHRLVGARALLFAAAPTLLFYTVLNWDLLAVAAAVGGIYAWRRDRPALCGALLAAGVCCKVWPGLILLAIAGDLLTRRRFRDLRVTLSAGGAVAASVNLPFALANFRGWEAPFVFQADRMIDRHADCLWQYVLTFPSVTTLNRVSESAFALALGLTLVAAVSRARGEGQFPAMPSAAAMVTLFVALGKVHSPQYALWVLPFFALVRVRALWWVGFVLTDAWLYAQWTVLSGSGALLESAVVVSDLFLLALALAFLRGDDATVAILPLAAGQPQRTPTEELVPALV